MEFLSVIIRAVNGVCIGAICHYFSVGTAIPFEIFVFAPKYNLSPAIVNNDFKINNLSLGVLWHKEAVVDAVVPCGSDGVRQVNVELTFWYKKLVGGNTVSIRGCDVVSSRMEHGDLGCRFPCTPLENSHFGLCEKVGGEVSAGIFRKHGDLEMVINAVHCHRDDRVATVRGLQVHVLRAVPGE